MQKQINDLKMNAVFSPAEQVLVDAAGTNAEESSRQLEEATEMMESLREELETSHATTKEYKIQLNRAFIGICFVWSRRQTMFLSLFWICFTPCNPLFMAP